MANGTSDQVKGVFAALPTPMGQEGDTLYEELNAVVDFLLARGVKGFCLGGATGEYAACSLEQRIDIFRSVARRAGARAKLICGIGAEHVGQVRKLARAAADCGALAVLFPTPAFLPYRQEDLVDFIAQVSVDLPLPVLIYHIPQCTRDLGISNILRLTSAIPNIIGFKDSSGVRPHLVDIQAMQAYKPMVFLIGRDELLADAFERGAAGTISGICSAWPEVVLPIYDLVQAGNIEQARALQEQLDDFISHIRELPVPWALKTALQVRGLEMGKMAWPLGPSLLHKLDEFQRWFAGLMAGNSGMPTAPTFIGIQRG